MTKVITLGTFDMLHLGHINLFKKCRDLGSCVIVGLNTDAFVYKFKHKWPVMKFKERKKVIMSLGLVDKVIANDQPHGSARNLIKKSGAKLIVIGSDWARKDYVKQLGTDWNWLDKNKIGIAYVNYTGGISTTELKRRLNET